MIEVGEVETPLGAVRYAVRDGRACALAFSEGWPRVARGLERRFGSAPWRAAGSDGIASALLRYFAGEPAALDAIEVDAGGTPFQRAVWAALRGIPLGETVSYGDVARRVGAPAAVRAVGAATGANPVGIVVPCHRVVRIDGGLGGYAGGLERKGWLLRHEFGLVPLRSSSGAQPAGAPRGACTRPVAV